MRNGFLHKKLYVGIVLISIFSYAQQPKVNINEEKNLQFQTHFFEALKQTAIKNYGKAIEQLEKCNQLDSNSVAVDFEFSKNYLLLKKYFEADIFIEKALEIEPQNMHLLSHKVAIYKAQQMFDLAINIQKELVKIKPIYNDDLVLLYIQNQNFEEAKNLIKIIEENGLKTTKIKGLKDYLLKQSEVTTVDIQTGIDLKKNDIETLKINYAKSKEYTILNQILWKELNTQMFDLLYLDSKDGLEFFPAQPFLYKMNAIALNKLQKYNEAIIVLTIGIDFVIDNNEMEADFYKQFSIAYDKLGNKSDALKYKQKENELRN